MRRNSLAPNKLLLLLLLLLLPVASPVFSGGRPGVAAIVAELEDRAAKGDSVALYHLSTLYERGYDSIPADTARSRELLLHSAEKGYAPAQNYLGYLLYAEKGDRQSAIYWLEKATEQNDMKGASNLAFLLLDSEATPEEESKALSLLTRAAESGLPAALDRLGDLYRTGRVVEPDTTKASLLYLEGTRRGAPDSEKKLLAMMNKRYDSLTPDEAMAEGLTAAAAGADVVAFTLFNRAAEGEIPRAYTLLGDAYAGAKGTDYDNSRAIKYYLKGAIYGDPSAQFILAELLEIFPDILNGHSAVADIIASPSASDIQSGGESPSDCATQTGHENDGITITELPPSSEDIRSPHYWYSRAASGGVTDAETATRLLFSL